LLAGLLVTAVRLAVLRDTKRLKAEPTGRAKLNGPSSSSP